MAHQEVSGTDEQLCHCIDSREIEAPGLINFNEWQKWRAGAGRRPTKKKDGVFTTPKQEALLWRATMAANHGEDWLIDLAALQGPIEDDDDELRKEATEDGAAASSLQAGTTGEFLNPGAAARSASPGSVVYTSPRRSSQGGVATPGSWRSDNAGSPGGLARTINKAFNPTEESLARYENGCDGTYLL